MSETATPETSAGTAETETVSATRAAADAGNIGAFLEADRASRTGKPSAAVTRPKAAPAAGEKAAAAVPGKGGKPATGPSAADRDADARLTTRIREAVETSTSQLKADNEALKRRLDEATRAPRTETAPTTPEASKGTPEYKRYLAMPDAPKVEDYESIIDHNAAMAIFIADTRHNERVAAERSGQAHFERAKQDIARVETFHGRINEHKKTDPEFAAKLSPEVKAMHGFGRLQQANAERQARGEPLIPASVDHAIAEELYDSEIPAQMAVHLSEHPEDLAALRKSPNPNALLKAFGRLEDRVRAGGKTAEETGTGGDGAGTNHQPSTAAALREQAAAVVERSVSSAAPPAPALGKPGTSVDPMRKAIETGDIGMFLELDRQAAAERRGLKR